MTALRRIRPTRRGTGVAFAVAIAALGGTRSLDAVAVPAAVALVVGAAQLARADRPRVRRTDPEPGAPGERRAVTVSVDSAVPCTVVEPVGEKLAVVDTPGGRGEGADRPGGETEVIEAVGHGGTFEYAVELGRRGEHRLGPARCRLVDSLGLFRATVPTEGGTTALVHPEIRAIDPTALPATGREPYGDDRSTFDRLREYTPGDSLRDIHWRASAKRPDEGFLIAEYSGRSGSARITLVGESGRDGADAMASAVASLAVHLVAAGETVTVVVPDGERSARPGETGGVLRVLALTGGGECTAAERARADVRVRAEGGAATVTASDRSVGFDALSTPPSRKRGEVPG